MLSSEIHYILIIIRGTRKHVEYSSLEVYLYIWVALKMGSDIYLLTAIGLSPGGSTHLHTNNT
jgi:hypothetical protein